MKKKMLVLAIVGAVAAAAIVSALVCIMFIKPPEQMGPAPHPGIRPDPIDRDLFMVPRGVITTVNLTLSAILIFIYISIYRKTKSEFTVSLIVVMMALFLYALLSNPLIPMLFGYRLFGMGLFTMLPELFTTIALVALLYISLK
ncbi:MAG: hypothetical protein HZB92_01325 [Euryarchaeota archaeon]|nr:hypothetical protein [Euryarchaeota archaeon]